MKLFLLVLLIGLSVSGRSQDPDFKVMHTLTAENYFKALDLYNHYQDSLSEKNRLMARTFLYSYFFQPEKAILTADTLFMRYKSSLNNTLYIVFANLTAENYAYVQDYAKAEAIMSELTNPESYIMSHAARESYEALQIQYAALKNNPPLQITRPDHATILPMMGATRTHLRIPVRINQQTKIMMLDTGAARNVITQKEAEALNARIISEPVLISGYGGRVKGQLAMIDEVVLGDITITNVPFVVIPDNDYITEYADGILGLSLISRLKEIHISAPEGKVVFPVQPAHYPIQNNLFIKKGSMFILSNIATDSLTFFFDSGFNNFFLNQSYYLKERSYIDRVGSKIQLETRGVGGTERSYAYEIPFYDLTVGTGEVSLIHVSVLPMSEGLAIANNYGSIGLSAINRFKWIQISFETCSINAIP